jgi:hypothetical protein
LGIAIVHHRSKLWEVDPRLLAVIVKSKLPPESGMTMGETAGVRFRVRFWLKLG